MTQPVVSAIVLSFNRRDETLACLEALRRQSYPALEIVVLDNGSTNGSPEAIAREFPAARLLRVPHQRYLLQSVQRLRALVSSYPGIARPLVESAWKLAVYAVGACRRRFVLHLPFDIASHVGAIARGLRERRRVRDETLHLIDYLISHRVSDASAYLAIDTSRGYFLDLARRRLRIPR